MHAFLITGATLEKRSEWVKEKMKEMEVSPFDMVRLIAETPSIGVADVRAFTKQLAFSPAHGKFLAGIIEEAHELTVEAANALLKTLEEPTPHCILLLQAITAESLLPTIISRCQIISLGTTEQYTADDLFQCFKTLKQLQQVSVGERIKLIDVIATDRQSAKAWVQQAIAASRSVLLENHSKESARTIRNLMQAERQLSANVTPKLVLDNIFL